MVFRTNEELQHFNHNELIRLSRGVQALAPYENGALASVDIVDYTLDVIRDLRKRVEVAEKEKPEKVEVIEHVHLDISSYDLRAHFEDRAAFHAKKRGEYLTKLESLKGLDLSQDIPSSNDPGKQLRSSAESHNQRAQSFKFRASYLVPQVIFRLNEQDLINLEFVDRIGGW